MRSKRLIFKVQRPVACTPGNEECIFVYDETRKHMFNGTSPDAYAMFEDDEYKFFCYGRFVNGKIVLDGRAPWQEW